MCPTVPRYHYAEPPPRRLNDTAKVLEELFRDVVLFVVRDLAHAKFVALAAARMRAGKFIGSAYLVTNKFSLLG